MNQQQPTRITAYFGDSLVQAGFTTVPHLLLRHMADLGIERSELVLLLNIFSIEFDWKEPPNTVKKLAARLNMTDRGVQKLCESLHNKGYLDIRPNQEIGGQRENTYDLSGLFHALRNYAPPPGEPQGTGSTNHSSPLGMNRSSPLNKNINKGESRENNKDPEEAKNEKMRRENERKEWNLPIDNTD